MAQNLLNHLPFSEYAYINTYTHTYKEREEGRQTDRETERQREIYREKPQTSNKILWKEVKTNQMRKAKAAYSDLGI
jgi:hypothetical protein